MVHLESSFKSVKNKDNVQELLIDILESVLHEADKTELVKKFCNLYDSSNGQVFKPSFEEVLMLIISDNKRSADVRKMLRFISDCALTLDNKYKTAHTKSSETEDEEEEEIMHPLLEYLFQILKRWSRASSYTVRCHVCQFLYMILTNIQENGVGEIAMSVYDNIAKIIEERRIDANAVVRSHAVLIAKFFQDPSSVNDPVISGLCWQLQNDPNARVRQNIVEILAACEETLLPLTGRFLYDQNANVRNAALLHICDRISPRSYTNNQRILILNQCFFDSSDIVRRNVEKRLIPVWFRAYGDKICNFLGSLRSGADSLDNLIFMNGLLLLLLKSVKIADVLEELDLDAETALPKIPLTGERIFLWRNFYRYAFHEEKLAQYIPQFENLHAYILKYFENLSLEEDHAYILNEFILFLTDIKNLIGVEKCGEFVSSIMNLVKNPFVSKDIMPYAVTLYVAYSTEAISYEELFQTIETLQAMAQFAGNEGKNMILKCFAIFDEILSQEDVIYTDRITTIKKQLVAPYLNSDDADLKSEAIKALSLYCLHSLEEAQYSWPFFMEEIHAKSSNIRSVLLKGIFDILKCHGQNVFCEAEDREVTFIDFLDDILSQSMDETEERDIIVKGILKIYTAHHIWSPRVLSKLMMLLYHPDENYSVRKYVNCFLQTYGHSREEVECLVKSFLAIISLLFDSDKSNPYHNISIKTTALELIEFSKEYEHSEEFSLKEKFQDLLVLKLTKAFLKKPWRLSALDLYNICSGIMPRDHEKLLKLKENIKIIIESLQSAIFQQTNPYSKRSIRFFSSYIKKIHAAIDAEPLVEANDDYTVKSSIPVELMSTDNEDQAAVPSRKSFTSEKVSAIHAESLVDTNNECQAASVAQKSNTTENESQLEARIQHKNSTFVQEHSPASSPIKSGSNAEVISSPE